VLHVLVVERAPQVGPLGDLHWVHACARQFRPEGDLEPALVSAVAFVAEGVGIAGAVDDDEELERLGGHGGRGRGRGRGGGQRQTSIVGPGPVGAKHHVHPLLFSRRFRRSALARPSSGRYSALRGGLRLSE
jgi:hypothetical protein